MVPKGTTACIKKGGDWVTSSDGYYFKCIEMV